MVHGRHDCQDTVDHVSWILASESVLWLYASKPITTPVDLTLVGFCSKAGLLIEL